MTRISEIKTTFTAGEVSEDLLGRGDLRAYDNGALKLRNVFINPTGGVTRRSGLSYIDTAAGNGKLIAFEFNTDQFSCWNRSDPNFRKLQEVDSKDLYFATALRIAARAVAGILKDSTNGATHYHAKSVDPYWARDEKPVATIGSHIFYRLLDGLER